MESEVVTRSNKLHKSIGIAIGILGIVVSAVILYPLNVKLFDRNGSTSPSNKGFYDNAIAVLPGNTVAAITFWIFNHFH